MLRFNTFKDKVMLTIFGAKKSNKQNKTNASHEKKRRYDMYHRQNFPYRSIMCNRWVCHPYYQNLVANDGVITDPSRLRSCPKAYRDMGYVNYNMWWIGNNQNGVLRLCSPKPRKSRSVNRSPEKTMENDSLMYILRKGKQDKKFPGSLNRANASSDTQQFLDRDIPQQKSVFKMPHKLSNWESYPTNQFY